MNELHPAYIAGVLDSDGSLSICIRHKIRKVPNYSAMFQLTWTFSEKSEKVMNTLKEKYGGSVYLNKLRTDVFKNSKQTMRYFLVAQELKPFILDILPYVQLKKEQCLNVLELLNSSYFGKYGNGRPKLKELCDFHHSLYLKNKELNTKNSGDRSNDCK